MAAAYTSTVASSLMPAVELIWDVVYSSRTEIFLFLFAFTLHQSLFGVPWWKVEDKRDKGNLKDRSSAFRRSSGDGSPRNMGDKGSPRKTAAHCEEDEARHVGNEDFDHVLRVSDAAYERGDYRAILRHWSTLRRMESMASAAHVAHAIEAMQRFQKDSNTIVFEVRSYLKRHMKTCDVAYVNRLLDSLGKSLDVDVTNAVVELMPSLHLSPDSGTYEVLVQMYFATRSFGDVTRLEEEMSAKGLKPMPRSALVFLKAALQTSQLDKALAWYREVADEPTPSAAPAHITAQLVELACREKRVDVVFEDIESGRIQLTTETLNTMLNECARAKNHKMMQQIEQLGATRGIVKNSRTIQLLTRGAGNDRARMQRLLQEIPSGEPASAQEAVHSILAYCTQSGDTMVADQLYSQSAKACDIFERHFMAPSCADDEAQHLVDAHMERTILSAALRCGREAVINAILTGSPSDTGKYIALIRGCVAKGNLDEAMKIFRALEKTGGDMAHSLWNATLDACVECGNIKRTEDLMARMQAEGIADAVSYNTVIKAHLKQNAYDRARVLMQEMRKQGFAPNHVTYNELIHSLSRSDRPQRRSQMWSVLDEMKRDGVQPNRITSSILLKGLHAKSSDAEIMRTMEVTDSMSEPMDEVLMSSVVEACVRVSKPQLVADRLEKLKGNQAIKITGAHTFGSLIKAYGFAKDIDGAWRCWKEMRSQHVIPTSITIGCMVEAVVSNGDVDGGYELICDLFDDPACMDHVNSIVYGSVLKGYSRARRMERVMEVFEEMISRGIAPAQTTYNTVIDACARNGQMAKVPEIMKEMKERKLEPNLITYSTVMKGFVQQGDVAAAVQTLDDLRSNRSLKPDEIVYNTILDGCAHAGMLDVGDRVFDEMLAEGIAPTTYTLTCMVKLKGQARQVDQAFDLVDSVTRKFRFKANAHVNGALVQACVSCREWDRAVAAFEQMIRDRAQPDGRSCQALIRGLLNAGDGVRAARLLRVASGTTPDVGASSRLVVDEAFVSEVTASLRRAGHEALATQLMADLRAGQPGSRQGDRRPSRWTGQQGPGLRGSRSRADQGPWR